MSVATRSARPVSFSPAYRPVTAAKAAVWPPACCCVVPVPPGLSGTGADLRLGGKSLRTSVPLVPLPDVLQKKTL